MQPGALVMFNTLRPRQDGRHFADDIFKCIFFNENVWIPIKISLKFVPKGPINNIPALVQIMAWHAPGDKPLSEPMVVSLPTHISVTRPQWVNHTIPFKGGYMTSLTSLSVTCSNKYVQKQIVCFGVCTIILNEKYMWLLLHELEVFTCNL